MNLLDNLLNKVYNWKSAYNRKETRTMAKESIAKTYDPIIEKEDGSKINKSTFAYLILEVADNFTYLLGDKKISDKERGQLLYEEIENLKDLGKTITGVL